MEMNKYIFLSLMFNTVSVFGRAVNFQSEEDKVYEKRGEFFDFEDDVNDDGFEITSHDMTIMSIIGLIFFIVSLFTALLVYVNRNNSYNIDSNNYVNNRFNTDNGRLTSENSLYTLPNYDTVVNSSLPIGTNPTIDINSYDNNVVNDVENINYHLPTYEEAVCESNSQH